MVPILGRPDVRRTSIVRRAASAGTSVLVTLALAACLSTSQPARASRQRPASAPSLSVAAVSSSWARLRWVMPRQAVRLQILRDGRLIDEFPGIFLNVCIWMIDFHEK